MSKELFDTIQHRVDTEIKPKIQKAFQSKQEVDDAGSPIENTKYDFRDMKRDLEGIQKEFCDEYPNELVFQKLFEVTL